MGGFDRVEIPTQLYVAFGCATVGAWVGHKIVSVREMPIPAVGLCGFGFLWGLHAPLTVPLTLCCAGVWSVLSLGNKTYQQVQKLRAAAALAEKEGSCSESSEGK